MNRKFDYASYLESTRQEGLHLTRLFALFRELQTSVNPYSTCKPESTDYVAPFRRVGPGLALDKLPKYDVSQWNGEFFQRLHEFLSLAMEHRIIVELTLFSNTYSDGVWELSPLNYQNNVNGLEEVKWFDYTTRRSPQLWEVQQAYVKNVLDEVRDCDNLIIEICNEPIGNFAVDGVVVGPTPEEIDDWQRELVQLVRSEAPSHPVAVSPAWSYEPWLVPVGPPGTLGADITNVHPLDVMQLGEDGFNLGIFMTADSRLDEYASFCKAVRSFKGPINIDEDNVATRFMDRRGWTIHRQRAWIALMSGCFYDCIDFSVLPGRERTKDGTTALLRTWFSILGRFWEENSLWLSRVDEGLVTGVSDGCVTVAARRDRGGSVSRYVYVATQLSNDLRLPHEDRPIEGSLLLGLPKGDHMVSWFLPETGIYTPSEPYRSEGEVELWPPGASNDVVAIVKSYA